MASSPSVQRVPSSTGPPGGIPSNSRGGGWGRNGDPGSAFSGLSRGGTRGAGRGNPRGGRGGRGARGGSSFRGAKPQIDAPVEASAVQKEKEKEKAPATSTSTSTTANIPPPLPSISTAKVTPAAVPSAAKPKPASRRPSRTVPAVVIAPVTPSSDVPPTPSSARTPNRRKRSQAQSKTPSSSNSDAKLKAPPPLDETLLGPQTNRLRSGSYSVTSKDTPPHMSHSLTTNIDALVERVRAVAMAENRPVTPGSQSHIDWAGDDDDSLPDLDDWGVKPVNGADHTEATLISPIIVEGLKSLPETTSPFIPPVEIELPPLTFPTLNPPPVTVPKQKNRFDKGKSRRDNSAPADLKDSMHTNITPQQSASPSKSSFLESQKASLHPSLPQKPVMTDTPIPPIQMRQVATPMRNPLPRSPPVEAPTFVTVSLERPKETTLVPEPVIQNVKAATHVPQPVATALNPPIDKSWKGLEHSMHAPKPIAAKVSIEVVDHSIPKPSLLERLDFTPKAPGLEASMHAPKPAIAQSLSAPSDISSYSTSSEPRGFNPTHNRNYTVGDSPFAANGNLNFSPNRYSRSGASTPRGGGNSRGHHHARTHSSPPTGGVTRTPHSRPVLTGAAISRLARTIEIGISPSPRAVVKDS